MAASTETSRTTPSNDQLGVTVPIKEGHTTDGHVEFTAQLTEPAPISFAVTATVHGQTFTGTVNVGGAGTFPFSGTRAT